MCDFWRSTIIHFGAKLGWKEWILARSRMHLLLISLHPAVASADVIVRSYNKDHPTS